MPPPMPEPSLVPDAGGGADAAATDAGGVAPDDAASSAAPSEPVGCAGAAFCDGFESAPAGGPPDPALWTVVFPDCHGGGGARVDGSRHHGGNQSVKVTAGGGYCDHALVQAARLPEAGRPLYGRFFLWLSQPLGEGHATFLALKDAHDGGHDLRMGGQKQVLMWNRQSDDATLPALGPVGVSKSARLAANVWTCIEFLVDGAGATLRTWVDEAPVEGLVADGTPTRDIDDQWLRGAGWKPAVTDVKLGWEAYAGQAMTLWIDDVALANQRLGCR